MLKMIKNHPNYLINESGVILDASTNSLVRTAVSNEGLLYTTLDGKYEFVSNLVYSTFGTNDIEGKNVIHKDKDPMNNHISNLSLSKRNDKVILDESRNNRSYSRGNYIYEVYNSDESDIIECIGRSSVASLIQYEEISLKNMVGNGRVISLGPYAGYQIRRTNKKGDL